MPSLDAKEQEYCKLHNSFDHSTQNCNMFRQIIQSAINSRQLKFAHVLENDQLESIGLGDKRLQNWPTSANSYNNGEKEGSNSLNNEKDIVHELQVRIFSRMMSLAILREALGGKHVLLK